MKKLKGMDEKVIIDDIKKDLKNNEYGSTMGTLYKNKSCLELLDDKRTENMRKMGIR